jgi:ATP-dependent Lon protease
MLDSPTPSLVIVLDEIEKKGTSGSGGDPRTCLYQLLEENSAENFKDEFVDFPADLSRVIYIACANETEGLSEPLLSRFMTFHVPDPTPEQQAEILQNIYQEQVAGSPLFSPTLNSLVIERLQDDSLRTAKVKISNAIGQALLELSEEEMAELPTRAKPIRIGTHHLKSDIKPKKKMGF